MTENTVRLIRHFLQTGIEVFHQLLKELDERTPDKPVEAPHYHIHDQAKIAEALAKLQSEPSEGDAKLSRQKQESRPYLISGEEERMFDDT